MTRQRRRPAVDADYYGDRTPARRSPAPWNHRHHISISKQNGNLSIGSREYFGQPSHHNFSSADE